jgi:hypothetical protein
MTYATLAAQQARQPCTVVEVDLDYYDDAGITATNPDGSLCYRTPATTNQGTFTLGTKTRKWQSEHVAPIAALGAIPCVRKVSVAAEEIRAAEGLGTFGKVSITLQDFVDDDRLEDPFWSDASRGDHKAGTYFGKLVARNPYWTGRALRVREGFVVDGAFDTVQAITRQYLIRDIQGPTGGVMTITAVGPLQLLGLNAIEAPAGTGGRLLADISASDMSTSITPEYTAEDYAASGYVRVNDEVIAYTRTGAIMTFTERGALNTVAASHSEGDSLQHCIYYQDQRIDDVLYDLLVTRGGVDASYIDVAGWEDEADQWLTLYQHTVLISEPVKVLDLVRELLESAGCYMWWDDQSALVRLRALRPAQDNDDTWTDAYHLLDTVGVSRDLSDRVSRTDVLIGLRSSIEDADEVGSYRVRVVGVSDGAEADEHRTEQLRIVKTRWLSEQQVSLASRISYQITATLKDGRKTFDMVVSAKDSAIKVGDIVVLQTRDIIDRNGNAESTRVLIVRREEVVHGSKYRYKAELLPFTGRFAFWTDTALGSLDFPDYDQATDAQRDPGGFWSNSDGTYPSPPYLWG